MMGVENFTKIQSIEQQGVKVTFMKSDKNFYVLVNGSWKCRKHIHRFDNYNDAAYYYDAIWEAIKP